MLAIFSHFLVAFIKVKLLTLSTNLLCSKYFVDGIGQNTISVEKFNLDFTLNSQSSKVQNFLTQQSALLAGLIVKVWNIFLIIFNAQPILNFSERSLIQLSSTVKFTNIELKISESFSSESGLSKKRHLSFCYIIHEMAIQVDFCYFCLCCFYIVPQHKLWKQTEDKKLRGFDQRVVPPVNCAVNQTCSNKKYISKMQQKQIHNLDSWSTISDSNLDLTRIILVQVFSKIL